MIITGYYGGPPASGSAVEFDIVSNVPWLIELPDGTITGPPAASGVNGVVLLADYWPVAVGVLGPRESFLVNMPFVCRAGTSLILPMPEITALIVYGIAK